MNYLAITKADIANGEGIRTVLWVSGCPHHCKGCHNPQSWLYSAGKVFSYQSLSDLWFEVTKPYCQGLTLSGGEPLCPQNIDLVTALAKFFKTWAPQKDIWCFTGYRFEEIKNHPILNYLDAIVDGEFVQQKRDVTLAFRGSLNQRIWKKENGEWFIADDVSKITEF